MDLNRTNVILDRVARNKENENWDMIEDSARKMKDDFNNTAQKLEDDLKNVVDNISDQVVDQLVDTAKLDWKEPVGTYSDLPTNPEVGETRQVRETGKVYRFDGVNWVEIQEYDASAINEVDSRLTTQLTDIAYSVKLFGAKGDGVIDDTVALRSAFDSGLHLFFPKGKYRITDSISKNYTSQCVLKADQAKIIFDPESHKEFAIRLSGRGIKFEISGITFDGNKMCNKPLEILNNAPSMARENLSMTLLTDVVSKRAKRNNNFSGGNGILIRGAFFLNALERVFVEDCELPKGQGVSGSVGVTGITITSYGETTFSKKSVLRNCEVEKVYSSDPAYNDDQDGLSVLGPFTLGYFRSELIVEDCTFTNCYGRSIKSQVYINHVNNSVFSRDEGFESKKGNGEIDFQVGGGTISGCTFEYKNGYQPGTCANLASNESAGKSSVKIENCEVYTDDVTMLDSFFTNFPRDGVHGRITLNDIKIYSAVKEPVVSRSNGSKHYLFISDWYIEKIVQGRTGEHAFVYIISSGAPPFYQHVVVEKCIYGGNEKPNIARDGISGNSTGSTVSAFGNIGFSHDKSKSSNGLGLKSSQVARIGRIGPDLDDPVMQTGFFEVKTLTIASNEVKTISVRNISATLLFIIGAFNQNAYAIFSSNFNNNTVISKGASFEIGANTEPANGSFKVWSSGQNQISIKNTDVNSRTFSIYEMSSN